jgi:hypothetical protein
VRDFSVKKQKKYQLKEEKKEQKEQENRNQTKVEAAAHPAEFAKVNNTALSQSKKHPVTKASQSGNHPVKEGHPKD